MVAWSGNAWDRLTRAMRQVDPSDDAGLWSMVTSGTVNIVGGGAGGTSTVDNNPFTPGGTSVTPAGGYQGGRQVASGNIGALAISPSGLLLVDVRAGGAGGGQANLTVRGTANSDIQVGYASGAGPNAAGGAYVPVLGTVNVVGGAGGFASAAVYGSPANPVYVVGSVQVVNGSLPMVNMGGSVGAIGAGGSIGAVGAGGSMGVTQVGAPWGFVGSAGVTPLATFTVALDKIPTVNLGLGTVNIGNAHGIFGSVSVSGTVNIVGGGAGGGFASTSVYGSPGFPIYIIGSVNVVNPGAGNGFASVAVYGSPANPVYMVGSVHIDATVSVNLVTALDQANDFVTVFQGTAASLNARVVGSVFITPPTNFTVWLANAAAGTGFASAAVYGSPANPVYIVGSVNVVNPHGIFGSVSVQGTVTLAAGAAPYASVAVYGSPANPVYVVGSAQIVNGSLPMISLGGSVGALGIGGSMGVTQIGSPWGVVGSVGVTPLASFTVNLGNIPTVNLGLGTVNIGNPHGIFGSVSVLGSVNLGAGGIVGIFGSVSAVVSANVGNFPAIQAVDTRGSLVGTIWPIAHAGSGYFAIANASLAGGRTVFLYAIHVSADNSAVVSFQSPSGSWLSGSIRIPGAAGFNMGPGQLGNPLIAGASNATLFLHAIGSGNIGGFAAGWIG